MAATNEAKRRKVLRNEFEQLIGKTRVAFAANSYARAPAILRGLTRLAEPHGPKVQAEPQRLPKLTEARLVFLYSDIDRKLVGLGAHGWLSNANIYSWLDLLIQGPKRVRATFLLGPVKFARLESELTRHGFTLTNPPLEFAAIRMIGESYKELCQKQIREREREREETDPRDILGI